VEFRYRLLHTAPLLCPPSLHSLIPLLGLKTLSFFILGLETLSFSILDLQTLLFTRIVSKLFSSPTELPAYLVGRLLSVAAAS